MDTFPESEIVLRHAQELEKEDKMAEAMQVLYDFITSKSDGVPWHKTLEMIMFKFVKLCVGLLNARAAKEPLIHYGYICLKDNVSSFEEVIKHFLHLSTERVDDSWNQAQSLDNALEVADIPDDLLLSYGSGKKRNNRSDPDDVTVWLNFLWETYWTVLDVLGTNSNLEILYSRTVQQAFQLCKQFMQTTKFSRICEILRGHLANVHKFRYDSDKLHLFAPEILRLCLDTRFEQLKVAYELALWKEAFCAVEDIYDVMCMMEKTPTASLMVLYYAELTEIFWVAKSHLYHAYAWLKIFLLQKSNKNLPQKDLQLIASSVVLASLSVAPDVAPFYFMLDTSHEELEDQKECNLKMVNLAGSHHDHKCREELSRSALLSELVTEGVISCAAQEVQGLYNLLENKHENRSSDLASKVQPLLTKLSKLGDNFSSAPIPDVQLEQYIPALEKLTAFRLEVQKNLKWFEEDRILRRARMERDRLEHERANKAKELVCAHLRTLKTPEERKAYIRSVDVFKAGN